MSLYIEGFIWLDWIVDKIISKHGVDPREVEEAFFNLPLKTQRIEQGKYRLLGRTNGGRYLLVIFAWENGRNALIISARDMTSSERQSYGRK